MTLESIAQAIAFPGGRQARLVLGGSGAPVHALLGALGLPAPRPLIVLNGGTARLSPSLERRLASVLEHGLVAFARARGCTLLTGGTDAGIFALVGRALARAPGHPPCIGVAPVGLVTWPGRAPPLPPPRPGAETVPLEPHHTHFVLVPGQRWGDETPAMLALADALGAGAPSAAVIAGGGEVTRTELAGHLQRRRAVIALKGSGRLADEAAAAVAGGQERRTHPSSGFEAGDIVVVALEEGPDSLLDALHRLLDPARSQP